MNTHHTTPKQGNEEDIDLFKQAFKASCEIYEPLGFAAVSDGELYHCDLGFPLLPFFERIDSSPDYIESAIFFALKSAFEAGRLAGIKQAELRP